MSRLSSFERIDYLLRTNKHIERKLVFDLIAAARNHINLARHWYLGLGSISFGDFRLAHRLLHINDLVSIERAAPERALFNKPYACIEVEAGDTGDVLARLPPSRWGKPVIAWMDYDGHLDSAVVADIDYLLSSILAESMLVMTLNARWDTYRVKTLGLTTRTRSQTSLGVIEGFLGTSSIPARFERGANSAGSHFDLASEEFPEFLCEALSTYMQHRVAHSARAAEDGDALLFLPLVKLCHRDGAEMVTVGGVITTEKNKDLWIESLRRQVLLSAGTGQPVYRSLDLVPVTIKEKLMLDECIPGPANDQSFLVNVRTAGLALADDQVLKYRTLYRYFPVFAEIPL